MNPSILILLGAGLFSIVCAVLDVDWFINSRKASLVVKLFGPNGARIFYILLGIAIIAMGVMTPFSEPSV